VDEGIPSGEWSLEIVGGEAILRPIEVSLCTAKPSCGFPDEECPVCKAGNCPGVKCWRCGR
jgi:hypothetical protein